MRVLVLLSILFFSIQSNSDAVLYNSSDISKQFELRTTPNYVLFDNEQKQEGFFNESQSFMTDENLSELKEKIHHGLFRASEYPNICDGSVTILYNLDGKNYKKDINLGKRFISGGHFFDKGDLTFQKDNSYLTAFDLIESLYSKKESKYIKLFEEKKGLELGIYLEDKIDKCIAGGAWRANCTHSEALFFLQLKQNLNVFFKALKHKITITGCVINISSYFDPCYKCLCLTQGFQWNLKHFMQALKNPHLEISDDFGTLCFIYGQKETAHAVVYGKGFGGIHEPVVFELGQHKFIQIISPERFFGDAQADDLVIEK
ncbi:MAG: hypothetical protein Q8S31_10735 [Alphaproteobacteria bacterium]|nr:hypothetical protein [Alphaproteobacteria bacterium]